jgi:hypothetical protein
MVVNTRRSASRADTPVSHRPGAAAARWRSPLLIQQIRASPLEGSPAFLDAFSLQQVSPPMPGDDLQACADREPKQRNERIDEPDAVDVMMARASDDQASLVVAGEEPIEDRRVDHGARRDLPWRTGPGRLGGWLDVSADEPSPEPGDRDLFDHDHRLPGERSLDGRQVHVVRHAEVLEALADAPDSWSWTPIQLAYGQSLRERRRACVARMELASQATAPGRGAVVGLSRHRRRYTPSSRLGARAIG